MQALGQRHGLGCESPVSVLRAVCVRQAGYDHVPAAPLLALGAHATEVGDKALELYMGGTRDQPGSCELNPEGLVHPRPETRDLDRSVSDLPQPSQHATDPSRILQMLPNRVELDCDHRVAKS